MTLKMIPRLGSGKKMRCKKTRTILPFFGHFSVNATIGPLVPEFRLGNAHSGSSASWPLHSTDTRHQPSEPT